MEKRLYTILAYLERLKELKVFDEDKSICWRYLNILVRKQYL